MTEVQYFSSPKALLYPSAQVYEWGTTLVVAPYPNHQLLSCGGAIALLRQMGYRVRVLFLGDGRDSLGTQPHDAAANLDAVVQQASLEAMAHVGVCEEASVYLQLRDGLFPHQGEPGFDESVRLVINELDELEPDTVVLPMLTNDQADLSATWQILREALRRFSASVKVVEYELLTAPPVETTITKPTAEYRVWRLDVKETLDQKVRALQHFQAKKGEKVPALDSLHPWETFVEYQT